MASRSSTSNLNIQEAYDSLIETIEIFRDRAKSLGHGAEVISAATIWLDNLVAILNSWSRNIGLDHLGRSTAQTDDSFPINQAKSHLLHVRQHLTDPKDLLNTVNDLLHSETAKATKDTPQPAYEAPFLDSVSRHLQALQNLINPVSMILANEASPGPYGHLKQYIDLVRDKFEASTVSTVQLLLEHEAEVNAKASDGMTTLHFAAESGDEAMVQLLLGRGAYVNAGVDNGKTALHFAAENGHEAVVQLLLDNGVNIGAKDKNGQTSLSYAVAKLLEALG